MCFNYLGLKFSGGGGFIQMPGSHPKMWTLKGVFGRSSQTGDSSSTSTDVVPR
jgi:hypothetical protein